MLSLLESIFGTYTPVTYEVYNAVTETYEQIIPAGFAGIDWPYVLGVAGFFIVLYCILRILGGVLSAK